LGQRPAFDCDVRLALVARGFRLERVFGFEDTEGEQLRNSSADVRRGQPCQIQPGRAAQSAQEQTRRREVRVEHRVLTQPALDRQVPAVVGEQFLQRAGRAGRHRWRHDSQLPQIFQRQRHALR